MENTNEINGFIIRKSTDADLPELKRVYDFAREFMKRSGNPRQWRTHPTEEELSANNATQNGYVLEWEGKICGAFAFFLGEDPAYREIRGKWLNDRPYGTLHRVASDGSRKGALKAMLDYCQGIIPNLRIDTHRDNKVMQHLLEKYGFCYCGDIFIHDDFGPHSLRLAYQREQKS